MASTQPDRDEIAIRRASSEDRAGIVALCRASLGWRPDDPNEAFFAWKHDENPFGKSLAWVAEAPDGSLVGLRIFLKWRFRSADGRLSSGVRAVDTATHPKWQGKGIFTRLTLGALPDLSDEGVDFVFNTPNDKSRPGYLKMGWSEVGRLPVGIHLSTVRSFAELIRSRTAAEMWSEATDTGEPAAEVLSDDSVESLLASLRTSGGLHTDRTVEYLRWRYRFGPLNYRVRLVGRSIEEGLVVFRLRRRGSALECAVAEVLVPPGVSVRSTVRSLARESGATYVLAVDRRHPVRDGMAPIPRLGPVLTWRPIRSAAVPAIRDLSFSLGDVELF